MYKKLLTLIAFTVLTLASHPQTMSFTTSEADYVTTTVFSEVMTFDFDIEIDAPLAPGVYNNPEIIEVSYRVRGGLAPNTPSNFTTFALERVITGSEFYTQGSSLSFEISQSAVLTDGVQVAELVGNGVVFTFNGRELDNGRFHPALFELRADGSGRIQNSNNQPQANPPQNIMFGEEYITDLMFDAGNVTLLTANEAPPAPPVIQIPVDDGGGGSLSLPIFLVLALLLWRRQVRARILR